MARKRKRGAAKKAAPETKKPRAFTLPKNGPATSQNKTSSLESHSQTILQAALLERQKMQLNYRLAIQQLQKQLSAAKENENKALQLFPEEVWVMIFHNIHETETLLKCSEASALFRRLTKQEEILFGKTLPFLSVYLSKSDILSCRQICSKWRSGVESLLESYHDIPRNSTNIAGVIPPPPTRRTRKFDFETILRFDEELVPELRANLLPGGSLLITNYFKLDSYRLPLDEWMKNKGKGVRHLTLAMKKEYAKLDDLQFLCGRFAKYCPYLRSLTLSGGLLAGSNPKSVELIFFDMPKLESLTITTKCSVLRNVQHNLIESLSAQLKQVTVCHWDAANYNKLPWNNLQELEIIAGNTSKNLKSLAKLTVPNLQKLKIRLDSSTQNLSQLFKALNNFSNLTSLGLTLTEQCPIWSAKEITKVPVDLLTINKIVNLKVVREELKVRRDFLVLFPFIRNLVLRDGENAARCGAFQDKSLEKDSDAYEDFSQDESSEDEATRKRNLKRSGHGRRYGGPGCLCCGSRVGGRRRSPEPIPPPPPPPEFLDLNKFCQTGNLKDIYKSNIWKVMPFLENLKFENVYCQRKGYRGRRRPPKRFTRITNFTKKAYNWERVEWKERQEWHVNKVWQEAKKQIKDKINTLQNGNVNTDKKEECITQEQKQEQQNLLQNQALAFVIQKLPKLSLLSCRRVSKSWKLLADKHFLYDELVSRDMVYRVTLEDNEPPIKWRYVNNSEESEFSPDFQEDSISASELNKKPISADIQESINKPFFGCITEIISKCPAYSLRNKVLWLLTALGKNIQHLRISSAKGMDVDDFYKISVQILQHCPNLRNVYFEFSNLWCTNARMDDLALRGQKPLQLHSNLESVTLLGPGPREWGMAPRAFSRMQPCENWLGSFVNFPNLKHVKMGADLSHAWMTTVENYLEALNLEKLELRLSGVESTIEQLVTVVNKFPKVKELGLEFYAKFGGLSNLGVIYTKPNRLARNITTVKITVNKKEEVSLDFLVHLPRLRELCITYGDGAAKWAKKKSTGHGSEDDSEDEDVYFREPERDYVQLVQYFGNKNPITHNTAEIIKSNIWTTLKRLEKLEVVCSLTDPLKGSTVFTRMQNKAAIEGK